jgi:isopentenyl diphosphate isomerase/L-lactate dehydrogenase-like FMN-dependent dehydrogenase
MAVTKIIQPLGGGKTGAATKLLCLGARAVGLGHAFLYTPSVGGFYSAACELYLTFIRTGIR